MASISRSQDDNNSQRDAGIEILLHFEKLTLITYYQKMTYCHQKMI